MSKVSLEGQVAVVTGAARGVGELLARKLSARGASVALVGLEPDLLKQVGERLHGDSDHWHADVTDHEAMARVAREVKERFGKVDIVVANAGVATGGPFVDSDPDSWRRVIEVNLIGSAVTGRAFLPVLMESRGYLLQIASLAAITLAPMMTAYCASSRAWRRTRTACAPRSATGVCGSGWATCPGPTPTWCAAPTRRTSCGSCGSGCPGRPTRRTRSARRWTGWWPQIERRSSHVYGQWWLRGMQGVRGYLPGLIGTVGQREMKRFAPRLQGMGTGLVGAGGAADEQARATVPR